MDEEKNILPDIDIDILDLAAQENEIEEVATVGDTVSVAEVSENDSEATQTDTMDYIMVDGPKETTIEVDDVLIAQEGTVMPQHTHGIGEIERLKDDLDKLGSAKDVYSINSGYAEFQQWKTNGYYQTEDFYEKSSGVGFFVSLTLETGAISGGNVRIDICKKVNNDNAIEVTDVYGVTVDDSGFCGNQSKNYNVLDSQSSNKNTPSYAKVCLLGNVEVRVSSEDYNNIVIGDYVVPNELGCATRSNNNIGFKVISKGQKEAVGDAVTAYYYVVIALVPQNDNIARVVAELEKTKGSLNNVNIQLGNISGVVDSITNISGKVDNIQETVNKNQAQVQQQLEMSQTIAQSAKDTIAEADRTMATISAQYSTLVNNITQAKDSVDKAIGDIAEVKANMKILADWPKVADESQESGVAGFVAQAAKNNTVLGSLTQAFDEKGTNLTAILQKIDENGAAIQHLVTHVDKYILSEQSPAYDPEYKLTLNQMSFIQAGTIYVPTKNHSESYKYKDGNEEKFKEIEFVIEATDDDGEPLGYGYSYMWTQAENKGYCEWKPIGKVSLSTEEIQGENDGDLWYCWRGSRDGDKLIREPGVLYRWTQVGDKESNKYLWVQVASNSDNAFSIGSVTQTAKDFQIAYTNLEGNIASLRVDVDEISSTIENIDDGNMTSINQTAEDIMMGVYDTEGGNSSSLGLLLKGLTSSTVNLNTKVIKTVPTAPPAANMYEYVPTWDGKKYVFSGESGNSASHIYFFEDADKTTYYCKALDLDKDGVFDSYEVYGISQVSMANLNTRVTNTESEVESWTRFQKGQNETMTSIEQNSSEKSADISSIVYGDFRECVAVGEGVNDDFAEDIYLDPPLYRDPENPSTLQFYYAEDSDKIVEANLTNGDNGYCLSKSDTQSYYKLYYRDDNEDGTFEIVAYEKYTMRSSPYTAIVQKIDSEGKASVGLAAGDETNMGGMFIDSINGDTTATIHANKVNINGEVTFASLFTPGTTTINGDSIKSGAITSNNYKGPVTYKEYGLKIDESTIVKGEDTDSIYFSEVTEGRAYDLSPTQNIVYYFATEIKEGTELTQYKYIGQAENETGYIVCATYFDFVDKDITISGTKFDLENGTIFSKNLRYNSDGDLTITGSLMSNQDSIYGTLQRGDNGVYVGPDGIGLANGVIAMHNDGNFHTAGPLRVWNALDKAKPDKYEDLIFAVIPSPDDSGPNVWLNGTMLVNGAMTWDAPINNIKVLYHSGRSANWTGVRVPEHPHNIYPYGEYDKYSESATYGWHTKYQSIKTESLFQDRYVCYSFNNGKTWEVIELIPSDYSTNLETFAPSYGTHIDAEFTKTPVVESNHVNSMDYSVYAGENLVGSIYYEVPEINRNDFVPYKMFVGTKNSVSLKIQSDHDLSIDANPQGVLHKLDGDDIIEEYFDDIRTVYIGSSGCNVNFFGANDVVFGGEGKTIRFRDKATIDFGPYCTVNSTGFNIYKHTSKTDETERLNVGYIGYYADENVEHMRIYSDAGNLFIDAKGALPSNPEPGEEVWGTGTITLGSGNSTIIDFTDAGFVNFGNFVNFKGATVNFDNCKVNGLDVAGGATAVFG